MMGTEESGVQELQEFRSCRMASQIVAMGHKGWLYKVRSDLENEGFPGGGLWWSAS